jgi:hypothetical protein
MQNPRMPFGAYYNVGPPTALSTAPLHPTHVLHPGFGLVTFGELNHTLICAQMQCTTT